MLVKLIGQLVFAATFMQLVPADVSFFEWDAGVVNTEPVFALEDQISANAHLPESELSENFSYPIKVDTDSYGIVTTAESAVVIDSKSNMMLLGKHPEQKRSIGSVTKLMSALVFLDTTPDLSQIVTLDPALDLVEGGRVYLAFYDGIELGDVLAVSIVGSDNTATEALVRFSGFSKDEFVLKMNEKAADLGMRDSVFKDPTGIDAGNMSTALDLVKLLQVTEQNETLSDLMKTANLSVIHKSGRVISVENTNQLLESFLNISPFEITCGKTGYLPEAGYVLASGIKKDGNEIYVVVLGADSKTDRFDEAKGLASWAFRVFDWP